MTEENKPGEAGGVTNPGADMSRFSTLSPVGSLDEAWKEGMAVEVANGPRGAIIRGLSGGFITSVTVFSAPRELFLSVKV